MTATAQDLSQFLTTVKEKVDSYNTERGQLVDSLKQIISSAQDLLGQLGEPATPPVAVKRRGRPAGSKNAVVAKRGPGRPAGSGKKKRTMSAEARKAISDAQKKRWAAQKAGGKKK